MTSYKYLGIHITADLGWDMHITNICTRSRQLLGLLYRKFYSSVDPAFLCLLYKSLVRPILEYACQVWDPYTVKNTKQLESVQNFALRICAHSWNIDHHILLGMFHTPTLAARREFLRIANNVSQNCNWLLLFSSQCACFPLANLAHSQLCDKRKWF